MGYVHSPNLFSLISSDAPAKLGAGTLAGADGSRQPTELELNLVKVHTKHFNGIVNQFVKGA